MTINKLINVMNTPININFALLTLLLVVTVQATLPKEPLSVNISSPLPAEPPWKSGAVTVTLSHDGTLTVGGAGAMEDYHYAGNPNPLWKITPWRHISHLVTDVIIEEGITHIGAGAFSFCPNLISVTIHNSVATIGADAFVHCGKLKSITIPASVTSIGNGAFYSTGLISVTIPGNVNIIGKEVFKHCRDLTSVTIENGITVIGEGAFCGQGFIASNP